MGEAREVHIQLICGDIFIVTTWRYTSAIPLAIEKNIEIWDCVTRQQLSRQHGLACECAKILAFLALKLVVRRSNQPVHKNRSYFRSILGCKQTAEKPFILQMEGCIASCFSWHYFQ